MIFATEEEEDDDIGDQLDRRPGELGDLREHPSMGIFPIQLLKREVKLSAAAAVAVIATLVFLEGLWALWSMLVEATQFHFGFQFALFGLIGGPLLLVGSKVGYWYSLIDMTANTILCVAAFTFFVCLDWFKFWSAGLTWGAVDPTGPVFFLALALVGLWSIRALRSAAVQTKFRK